MQRGPCTTSCYAPPPLIITSKNKQGFVGGNAWGLCQLLPCLFLQDKLEVKPGVFVSYASLACLQERGLAGLVAGLACS